MNEKRYAYICATDIPPICGYQKWRTQFDVWNEKLYGVEQELSESRKELCNWGIILEPIIAAEFEKRTGKKAAKGSFTILSPTSRHACTPDYIVRGKSNKLALLECKTCHAFAAKNWGDPDSDNPKIPDEYYLQVQWQMHVTGLDECFVAVLIGGNDFRIYTIKRNDSIIHVLCQRADKFWTEYIDTEEMPPPIGSDKENKFLDRKIPEKNREIVQANLEQASMLEEYIEAKQDLEKVTQKVEKLKAQIKLQIGENGGIEHQDIKCTWYEQKGRKSTKYAQIIKELDVSQEIIEKHTSVGKPLRVFKFEVN